ncbi:hypothetical protein Cylst_2212 [Cylindrospermum stagnale PCC 7417]|uniref:Uncharacterized protein n=1 Tax=Cylindrospermum stagnale PCC 7417 TaxID=56107 RepID=K9WXA0_9NOST|nr:hypothetical protein [Cylindrospermum stagnale]AFZ24444.1 hypothetical protein Cylst_2212 [Cylindrospermum stagnale PCC 7417]
MTQISLSLAMGYGKDITHQVTLRVMPTANLLYETLFAFGERHFAEFPPGHYANVTETARRRMPEGL